jgi:hypothetical protein
MRHAPSLPRLLKNEELRFMLCYAGPLVARFTIVGQVRNRQVIATGRRIRELARLQAEYGRGNWRKYKGQATVQYSDGRMREAEVHWYEAHGIGRQEVKIKTHLD